MQPAVSSLARRVGRRFISASPKVAAPAGAAEGAMLPYSSPYNLEIPEIPLTQYLTENFAKFGDKPGCIDAASGRTVTFTQMNTRIGTLQNFLKAKGFKGGDVMNIHLPNMPEYQIIFAAVAGLGGVNTTSNPLYTSQELGHQLRDSKAKFIVTVAPFLETAKAAAKDSNVQNIFVLGPEENGKFFFADDGKTKAYTEPGINPKEQVVALPYSSGTTGLPKGVMLTHYNLVSNVAQITAHPKLSADIRTEDVCLGLLPAFHIYGLTLVLNACIRMGTTVVTMPKFEPAPFLETLQKYKVSYAPLVPPIMAFMARHPVVQKFDLSSLRVVFSGAAPLDADTQSELQKRLPKARICQGYGMSETSPVTHVPLPSNIIPGSVGLPIPNTSCRIVSTETGRDLPAGPDNVGELWIKGPQVMKGYLNNPTATEGTMAPNGWLKTGDIGWRDAEGNTYIKDRLKEFIKVKGFQVAPAELEGLLIGHPALADAGVTSMKDERSGELPVAFVVKKQLPPGSPAPAQPLPEVTESSVKEWLKPKVAEYKMPAAVVFVDAIPKSAAGKILRRVLKEQVPAAMEARKASMV